MFTRFQPPTTRWFNSWPNFIPKRWRSLNLWVRATFSPCQKDHNRRIARFIQVHGWQSVVNLHGTIKIHQIHSLKLTYPDPVKNAGWKTISLWKSFLFYCHLPFVFPGLLGFGQVMQGKCSTEWFLGFTKFEAELKLGWDGTTRILITTTTITTATATTATTTATTARRRRRWWWWWWWIWYGKPS